MMANRNLAYLLGLVPLLMGTGKTGSGMMGALGSLFARKDGGMAPIMEAGQNLTVPGPPSKAALETMNLPGFPAAAAAGGSSQLGGPETLMLLQSLFGNKGGNTPTNIQPPQQNIQPRQNMNFGPTVDLCAHFPPNSPEWFQCKLQHGLGEWR